MSQEIRNDDEIDLGQVLKAVKRFGINVLVGIVSIISFYRKKALLFFILLIVGIVGGYFLDKQLNNTKEYKQEIIIEPKYESLDYIYNFIENVPDRLKDETAISSLGINMDQVKNLKEIIIEPIVVMEDVMDQLHNEYEDQGFHHILQDYTEDDLTSDRFRNFYKHHRLVFLFKSADRENVRITESIINHLRSQEYFKDQIQLRIKQATLELEKNKASLDFIDRYLSGLNSGTVDKEKQVVIIAEESQTPTIAGLLKQKASILEKIKQNEYIISLENQVFSIVADSGLVLSYKPLQKRMFFLIPIILCGLVSLMYCVSFLFQKIKTVLESNEGY